MIDLKPDFEELIKNISQRNMYSGAKVPQSIIDMFEIEIRENGGGVLVPYWISVLQKGRGPRKSTKDGGLAKKLYRWMEKHNMFKSRTPEGKISEAKSMAWYINKYGNKQFRSKVFVDIYKTEREKTIQEIDRKFSLLIGKITKQVV
jgi:hypothetical protein